MVNMDRNRFGRARGLLPDRHEHEVDPNRGETKGRFRNSSYFF